MIKKVGYFVVCPMTMVAKPLNWQSTFRWKINYRIIPGILAVIAKAVLGGMFFRTREAPVIDGLAINQIKSFDERFDRLQSRLTGQYHIMTDRNKDYLNWRFSAPGTDYKIFAAEQGGEVRGYLVLCDRIIRNIKTSIIFDLIADSEEVMHSLVSEAEKYCKKAGSTLIVYSYVAGRPYHFVLKRNGFITIPLVLRNKNSVEGHYFCAFSNNPEVPEDFLKDARNWLFQTADTDTL
jgi:hypothetical protein